jgi:hypothetical protein
VTERIDHLIDIANRGTPGRFVRLLQHAQRLADDFVGNSPADHFAHIREIDDIMVLEANGRHHPEDQRHHTRKKANAEEDLLGGWKPTPLLND